MFLIWNIWNNSFWTAVIDESEEWSSQWIFQFKQLERRSLKKSGLQRDLNPWPPRCRCVALPTELRSFFTFIYNRSSKWIISYISHHFTPHGRYELNKLTSLPMCGFIAQLVEQRTGNAEVTGSNPVEALIFSGFFFLALENSLRRSFFTLKLCFYLLYYYPQKFVIFTCRYFKLSWNTSALSQLNCRNFLCSSTRIQIDLYVTLCIVCSHLMWIIPLPRYKRRSLFTEPTSYSGHWACGMSVYWWY